MEIGELSKYRIAPSLISRLEELGYQTLTKVQQQAVEKGLFERKNILVIAPTNTGKTFVGELAALAASTQRELTHTFFLVPLKALADEKFQDFSNKYAKWGLKVAISTGDRTDFDDDLLSYQVIVVTYEKMNALLVRSPELIGDVGVIVIDELQNISDATRGVTLEILLTRLVSSSPRPQVVGLSATISNAKQVAEWLNAVLVETDKRDVELREGIIYTGNEPVQLDGRSLERGDFVYREFNTGAVEAERNLQYHTLDGLSKVSKSDQILIFVQTQKDAETLAEKLARTLNPVNGVTEVIEHLDSAVESTPSTRRLKETIQNGVAFHHAGLLPDERVIVEDAFDKGLIRIVCATTTLGAGVNTPAKDVIFQSHQTYDEKNIKARDYKNMSGRAGRIRTADSFGRSVMFAGDERELQMLWTGYITAMPEPLESQIGKSERLDISILGLLCSRVCQDVDSLLTFMKATFFGQIYYRQTSDPLKKIFDESIIQHVKNLQKNGFLTVEQDRIAVTEFGRRCAEEMLSPSSARLFFNSLHNSESRLAKKQDYSKLIEPIIHLACCTYDAISNNALVFYPKYRPAEIKDLSNYWESNKGSFFSKLSDEGLHIRSLKTTRMLLDLIQGASYGDLTTYDSHGRVKRDAETMSWLVRGLSRIAEKPLFNFDYDFVRFLRTLSERLYYGVTENALPVMRMRIPQVNRHRAMGLAVAGFNSIDKIIDARPEALMKVPGISEKLALEIQKSVEQYIDDENLAAYHRQRRLAQSLGKNAIIFDRLYTDKGDKFARVFNDIFKDYMGMKSAFVGDASEHEVDVIVETQEGEIVIEGKRYDNRTVSAKEAEEIIGKGAKHAPIAHVTIGYPGFADEAKWNCPRAKVTLISASVLGDMLIGFWQGKLTQDDILRTLRSNRCVEDPYQEAREIALL
jgi:helicase